LIDTDPSPQACPGTGIAPPADIFEV